MQTPEVLTLTMNPALDLSTATERVQESHKLRCLAARFHPGGGGINVARVLTRLGSECLAVYPAGGTTGERLGQLLDAERVPRQALAIGGETRESFSVTETSSGREFRFVLPGPELSTSEWSACLAWIEALDPLPGWLVASGSLPPGVPDDFYARVAGLARRRGSKLVLDTSGPSLGAALAEGVHLVKPSLRELRELTGLPLETAMQRREAAQALIHAGQAQVVALSLGAEGALLVHAHGAFKASSIAVPVASTIGAGDSFVGGLVWASSRRATIEQAFRSAMAAGAAALLVPGTALCQASDVTRFSEQVRIEPA